MVELCIVFVAILFIVTICLLVSSKNKRKRNQNNYNQPNYTNSPPQNGYSPTGQYNPQPNHTNSPPQNGYSPTGQYNPQPNHTNLPPQNGYSPTGQYIPQPNHTNLPPQNGYSPTGQYNSQPNHTNLPPQNGYSPTGQYIPQPNHTNLPPQNGYSPTGQCSQQQNNHSQSNIINGNNQNQLHNAEQNNITFPYYRKYILTSNELSYYKILNEVASDNNFAVLAKVRLADLLGVKKGVTNREWGIYFGKIKAKHIDFILADRNNLNPIMLIEIDDSSHDRADRQQRDEFVDKACIEAGYKILHVRGLNGCKEKILSSINMNKNTENIQYRQYS